MRRRLRLRLLLVVMSVLASGLVAEVLFRLAAVDSSAYSVASTGDQYHFYRFDPRLGWANAAGANGEFARDEFRYQVTINEHGMRQGPVALAPAEGVRRIAVIGDSFVWGIGVDDAARMTEQLQARLSGVEVLNFGVSGYAPVQHLRNLDHVLEFRPDMVVLVFCLGNDFVDNVQFVRYGYYKPYAELDTDGALRILGDPLPDTKAFGFEARPTLLGSRLLGAGARLLFGQPKLEVQRGLGLLTEAAMYSAGDDEAVAQQRTAAIAINRALLATIAARLRDAGVGLLVVPAPTKFEYNRAGTYGHEGVFPELEVILRTSCEQEGIPFLPMVEHLGGEDFWVRDGHWNAAGHGKVADALAAHLSARGYRRVR